MEFWPSQQSDSADIRGVMWLDPVSKALESIDFTFTGLKDAFNPNLLAGRIEFDRLSDGSFNLSKWYIRLPRTQVYAFGSHEANRLPIGVDEGGGEVLGLAASDRHADVSGVVTGIVFDSINGQPLSNVIVYLAGTEHRDTTDSLGHFTLRRVTTGTHYISFFHPLFAALPPNALAKRIQVQHGATVRVSLALPSAETMIGMLCSKEDFDAVKNPFWKGTIGVLAGRVFSEGSPVDKASLVIEWQTVRHVIDFSGETDLNGRFKICGLPARQEFTVRIKKGAKESSAKLTDFQRVLARDFELK